MQFQLFLIVNKLLFKILVKNDLKLNQIPISLSLMLGIWV